MLKVHLTTFKCVELATKSIIWNKMESFVNNAELSRFKKLYFGSLMTSSAKILGPISLF